MSDRDEFESAYVAHVSAQNISNVLGQHGCTVEEIAAMRYGDSYNVGGIGMRGGYLNGCWDGWKLARAPQAVPALTAEAFYDGTSKEPCLMWTYDGYVPGPNDVVLYAAAPQPTTEDPA